MTTAATARTLALDVWADVACPWCWIGERRLEAALARLTAERPEVTVERRWRAFQLQPGLPRGGVDWARFAAEKFGGAARMEQAFAHVAAAGEAEGLRFRFDRMTVAPNTADAHRLIRHARDAERRPGHAGAAEANDAGARELAMADALFQAYFAEGRNVSDPEVLADVAVHLGLERAATLDFLAGDRYADEVAASQREAARLGIRGVPFVVLDDRLAISGAQPAELFDRALRAALDEAA